MSGEAERQLDVHTTAGFVRGVREGPTLAWRGMPYAAAPVGALRFRAPQPPAPWRGVRQAQQFGPVAVQAHRGQFKGVGPGFPSGEDCLSVNVITSATDRASVDSTAHGPAAHNAPTDGAGRLRPVMVYIHGGGYSAGSSRDFSGQGESFVRSGEVVYVSFNYRLGPLGYLDFRAYSTPERPIEANLGLRDQVAALRWVQQNIEAFGGDPANVTLFGESAGGNAVTTLLATPSAAGLFARAIAQSPPPAAVYPAELTALWAAEFIEILRGQTANTSAPAPASRGPRARPLNRTPLPGPSTALLTPAELLDRASATDLVTASLTLQLHTPDAQPGTFCLAPVIDGDGLPEHPLDAFREGRAHRVPLIIGTNDREGSIFRGRIDILPRSPRRIRSLFERAPVHSRRAMQYAYAGLPGRRAAADFAGDFAFWYPSTRVADLHSRFAEVHCYRFDVAPRLLRLVGLDATHGVEMYALFDQVDAALARAMTAFGGREPFSSAGERMRDNWLRFAEGRPLAGGWPPYSADDRQTLIIGDTDHTEADPRRARRLAWEAFLAA